MTVSSASSDAAAAATTGASTGASDVRFGEMRSSLGASEPYL